MLAAMIVMNFQVKLERQLYPNHHGLDCQTKGFECTQKNGEPLVGFAVRALCKLIQKINCKESRVRTITEEAEESLNQIGAYKHGKEEKDSRNIVEDSGVNHKKVTEYSLYLYTNKQKG